MASYIDKEIIKRMILEEGIYCDTEEDKRYSASKIDDMPSANVVEVVRCKDCKYRQEGGEWHYFCDLDTGDPFELGRNAEVDNWFCADGERRKNET